jgi:hypothetical protein
MRLFLSLGFTVLLGCVPPDDSDRTARAIERLTAELARRERPVVNVPPPDLEPLLRELRTLKAERRYTGARVHVDAQRGRCLPCEFLKRDLERLAKQTKWTVGTGESVHWQIVPHARPDFAVPRIEYVVDGRVVDVVDGYPNTATRTGYYGPIDEIVKRHPQVTK